MVRKIECLVCGAQVGHQAVRLIPVPCLIQFGRCHCFLRKAAEFRGDCLFGLPDVRTVPQPATEDYKARISITGKVDVGIAEELLLPYKQ